MQAAGDVFRRGSSVARVKAVFRRYANRMGIQTGAAHAGGLARIRSCGVPLGTTHLHRHRARALVGGGR
jgi:hypothetical protein